MPTIEQVQWANPSLAGAATFYVGQNHPAAVVLHRMQGHLSTAIVWARAGHFGASWRWTVGLDGRILQHMAATDGGYHAGIPSTAPRPTWPLWRGHGVNVNTYTDSIECEGFEGGDWPEAQLASLKWLCQKLAQENGHPYDREHFPAHAEIDVVNRVNDFDRPERRHIVYDYLFEPEEDMPDPRVDKLIAALGGEAEIDAWNAKGNSLLLGYALEQEKLASHIANHPGGILTGVTSDDIANAITRGAKIAGDYIRNAAQRGNGG